MRLVLFVFALVAGVGLAVASLVADLPVATLIFGLLIAVVGVAGLVLRRRAAVPAVSPSPPREAPAAAKPAGDREAAAAPAVAEPAPGREAAVAPAVAEPAPGRAAAAALDRGAALEAADDLDGAIAAYREAAEADDPRVAPVGHLRIGTVLARRAELPAAEEQARQALSYPAGQHTVAATILLASVAMRAGKTDVAKTAVARLAAADDPQQAAAGRAYRAMFAIADGDVSADNLATLKAASNSGDQLTGSFLELIQQATDASSRPRPEPGTGEG
jgi:hypothetical protein